MFKSKISLLSGAAFVVSLSLMPLEAHAMLGQDTTDVTEQNSSIGSEKELEKQKIDVMVAKYPLGNYWGNKDLKAAARQGDEDARDEMIRRFSSDILKLDPKVDFEGFLKFPNLENRILTKPGYAIVLFTYFKDQYSTHLPDIVQKIQAEAERGHALAQFNLGWMYANGLGGLKEDNVEAVKWYQKAADQELAHALNNLGMMYSGSEMIKLFQRAADLGFADAQKQMGWLYLNSDRVKKDVGTALTWYQKAGDQGHFLTQSILGVSLERGLGVMRDEGEAVKWYMLSGEGQSNYIIEGFMKRHLPLNKGAGLENVNKEFSYSNLQNLTKNFEETQIEHAHQSQLHDSAGGLLEHQFAIPGFKKTYQELSDLELNVLGILKNLKGIRPGFMVQAVTPSEEIVKAAKNSQTRPFFSVDEFEGTLYLSVGFENCTIVKKFLSALEGFDDDDTMKEATQRLASLKVPYETLFTEVRVKLLKLNYAFKDEHNKLGPSPKGEAKSQFTEKVTLLKIQFDEQLAELEKIKKGIGQDLQRLNDDAENLRKAVRFLNGFVKGGLASRDQEFLDEFDYLQ